MTHQPQSKLKKSPKSTYGVLTDNERQRIAQSIINGEMGGMIKSDEPLMKIIYNVVHTKIYAQ